MFYVFFCILLSPLLLKHIRKLYFLLAYVYIFWISLIFNFGIRYWVGDDPQLEWSKHCTWFMGVRCHKKHGSAPINDDGPTILLGNHRGVADAVVHDVITEGTANFLSRNIVILMLPLNYI